MTTPPAAVPVREGGAPTNDGRILRYMEAGAGSPVVVFESGAGASGRCWAGVQALGASRARAVLYDRAGLGRSDRDPQPRTLRRAAQDLGALLDHLGPGPFVLVGHSLGGPIVRLAAAAHPDRISGLVLVDPTDETCDLYFSPSTMRQQRIGVAVLAIAARVGLARRVARRLGRTLPDWAARDLEELDAGRAAVPAFRAELVSLVEDLRDLRADPPNLGGQRVTIISGTRRSRFGAAQRRALVTAHETSAAALPGGRHVRAEHSGHLVPFSEPQVIAEEILRLVASAPPPGSS